MTRTVPQAVHSIVNSSAMARVLMAGAVPRLAGHRDHASRALRRAAWSTALARTPREERVWIERIEGRRRILAAAADPEIGVNAATPSTGRPEVAAPSQNPIELAVASLFMSIPSLWGRFLLRLVRELAPRSALELGTAFGISTAFQAAALELNGKGRLTSLDAAHDWGAVAEQGFDELGLETRVELRLGRIEDTLEGVLREAAPVGFAFVDAEHQTAPTLRYFQQMLPHLEPGAVVVFDDIAFDREMRSAWRKIRRHPNVGTAIDLGRMGVVRPRAGIRSPARSGGPSPPDTLAA